ncbi:class I SAM-dependent methyltransferase [Nocardioides sp. Y6]|uniref:Class I SAM-dependent methyltransferase n=1 Tax=Nocardioides malaquae TaxID=2773426 RepID=A0ABR9RW96_9ACTN|nr:class I SAM-dependent methyltransferase [Nocardioides malaquae]MBE7325442.1 class I SAM-dependent methyltransferase [Nocardioides malaquae]
MPDLPLLADAHLPGQLRSALERASFTYATVADLLGPRAHEALGRNETTPGERVTRGGSPLETLTRLFTLQRPVTRAHADTALPGLVDRLVEAGVLEGSAGELRAAVDVRPYASDDGDGSDASADLWVLSDLTPGMDGRPHRVGGDYVLGVSPASTSLAQLTMRTPVARALDLGTGCGVQALHLATHADAVVATDVNARALTMARFTMALNGIDTVDVRDGSFFEPVAGEKFDLIATNPPFVISPATGERLVYRDSGLPGDQVVEHVVRRGVDHLSEGGWLQVLANWAVAEGTPWDERLAAWLPDGTSAFVVQREVLDPAAYVELWLKDAGLHGGPDYTERYDTWLGWMEAQGIEGIGFGWINVRRGGEARELLDWPYDVEQPIAPAIEEWEASHDALAGVDDLSAERLVVRSDVRQETQGAPGAEDPETIVLRQQRGMRRARQVDTLEAAMVGACDGDLEVGQILDAVASLLGQDPEGVRTQVLPAVREMVAEGFLDLA